MEDNTSHSYVILLFKKNIDFFNTSLVELELEFWKILKLAKAASKNQFKPTFFVFEKQYI